MVGSPLWISGVLSSVAAAPTTVENVLDNADAVQYQFGIETTRTALKHTLRPRGKPQWAVVTTPNPGSYAGIPGSIQYYAGDLPISTGHLMYYSNVVICEFRSRI